MTAFVSPAMADRAPAIEVIAEMTDISMASGSYSLTPHLQKAEERNPHVLHNSRVMLVGIRGTSARPPLRDFSGPLHVWASRPVRFHCTV